MLRHFTPVFVCGLAAAQVSFEHQASALLPEQMVPVVAFDADGDGDDDWICNAFPFSVLLRNLGGGDYSAAPPLLPGGSFLGTAAVGDVDNDGDPDVVVGSSFFGNSTSHLLRNDGTGNFVASSWPQTPGAARCLLLLDADGDGDLDLFEGHWALTFDCPFGCPEPNRFYLNNGTGGFTPATLPGAPAYTIGGVSGDFDGDGRVDVIVGMQPWSGVVPGGYRYYRNQGTGGFAVSPMPATTRRPVALHAADFDGDGDLDVAAATQTGVELLVNQGTGQFQIVPLPLPPPPASTTVNGLAAGDIDGDGDVDLLATIGLYGDDQPVLTPQLLRNDGATFTDVSSTQFAELEGPSFTPSLVDFDGDGDLDATLWCRSRMRVALNNGQGRFLALEVVDFDNDGSQVRSVSCADIDGDRDVDVVTVSQATAGQSNLGPLRLYRNDGTGSFARIQLPGSTTYAVDFLDVDGDTDLDAYLVKFPSHALLINDGTGTFTDESVIRLPVTTGSTPTAHGDVDNDGDLDILLGAASPTAPPMRLLQNQGGGVFADASATLPSAPGVIAMSLVDLDGDGDLDLLTADGQQLHRFDNGGGGQFQPADQRVVGNRSLATDLVVGDFDGDARPDLVVPPTRLFRNNASGTLTLQATPLPTAYQSAPRWAADFDADGDLDLVHKAAYDSNLDAAALVNDGSGNFTLAVRQGPIAGQHPLAAPVDIDGDGDLDLVGRYLLRNQLHQLRMLVPARLGAAAVIGIRTPPGVPSVVVIGADTRRLTPPVVVPGVGLLHLDPATLVLKSIHLVPASGVFDEIRPVPNDPYLLGLTIWLQALEAPAAALQQCRLGNLVAVPMRL